MVSLLIPLQLLNLFLIFHKISVEIIDLILVIILILLIFFDGREKQKQKTLYTISLEKCHCTIYDILFFFFNVRISWFSKLVAGKFTNFMSQLILFIISHFHCDYGIPKRICKTPYCFEFYKILHVFILCKAYFFCQIFLLVL